MREGIFILLLILIICQSIATVKADEISVNELMQDEFAGEGFGDQYGYDEPEGELEERSEPNAATELQSWEEIEAFVKNAEFETTVVGLFDSVTHPNDLETFQEIAMTDGYIYRFAFTTNKSILESKKNSGCAVFVYPPTKYINEKMERSKYRFPLPTIAGKQQSVLDFVKLKSITLAGEYTSRNRAVYDGLQKPVVLVFAPIDHERNSKGFNYLANRVRKVAKKYEGKIVFALADTDSYTYAMETDYGFESPSNKETFVGLRDGDMYYKMQEKFSVENLLAFIEKFKTGEIEGKQKAASHPDEHDHGREEEEVDMHPVISVGNENVKDVIDNSSSDVMIEFYAPWCGHCRELKPEYKKVGEYFEKDNGITVAAFDATAASVPGNFDVQGYPTLYFVPANNKDEPIPYEGERSAKDIIKFINSHRTKPMHSEL